MSQAVPGDKDGLEGHDSGSIDRSNRPPQSIDRSDHLNSIDPPKTQASMAEAEQPIEITFAGALIHLVQMREQQRRLLQERVERRRRQERWE